MTQPAETAGRLARPTRVKETRGGRLPAPGKVCCELRTAEVGFQASESAGRKNLEPPLGPIQLLQTSPRPTSGPLVLAPSPQPTSRTTQPPNPTMSAPVKTLASIAAPTVAQTTEPVEAAPRQNAAEKAAVDRGLAETRVESIRIDGLVSWHHQSPKPCVPDA